MTKSYKTILALLLAMLCFDMAHAQSMVTFYNNDGQAFETWSLNEVGKLAFDEGNIVVTYQTGTYTVALNEVLSIKFTDKTSPDVTSIEKINDDAALVRISTDESTINVTGATRGPVAIWAITGQQIYSNRNWNGEPIDIAHLERGIYIITINNTTFKFKK